MCGVLASTFLLVNCQKAPNRPVKAPAAGVGPAGKTDGKIVECSPAFLKAFGPTYELAGKLDAQIKEITKKDEKEKLDAQAKESLRKEANSLAALTKLSVDELAKLNAAGCEATDAKTKTKKGPYTIKMLNDVSERTGTIIKELTGGLENDGAKAAEASKQEKENTVEKNGFKITKEFGEMFDASNREFSYFMNGKIEKKNIDEAKKDKNSTVCYITESNGKLEEDSVIKFLPAGSLSLVSNSNRQTLSKKFNGKAEGDETFGLYEIECLIADGKRSEAEFKKALGNLISENTAAAASSDATLTIDDKATQAREEAARKSKVETEKVNAKKIADDKVNAEAAKKADDDKKAAEAAEAAKKAAGGTPVKAAGSTPVVQSVTGTTTAELAKAAIAKALEEKKAEEAAASTKANSQSSAMTAPPAAAQASAVDARTGEEVDAQVTIVDGSVKSKATTAAQAKAAAAAAIAEQKASNTPAMTSALPAAQMTGQPAQTAVVVKEEKKEEHSFTGSIAKHFKGLTNLLNTDDMRASDKARFQEGLAKQKQAEEAAKLNPPVKKEESKGFFSSMKEFFTVDYTDGSQTEAAKANK